MQSSYASSSYGRYTYERLHKAARSRRQGKIN
jgi:hypothetical protein